MNKLISAQNQITKLNQQIASLVTSKAKKITTSPRIVENILNNRRKIWKIFSSLETDIPRNLEITTIDINSTEVIFSGTTNSLYSLKTLIAIRESNSNKQRYHLRTLNQEDTNHSFSLIWKL